MGKTIVTKFTETFLCMPEEETFKYFEIFKKPLIWNPRQELIHMEFPLETEFNGTLRSFY